MTDCPETRKRFEKAAQFYAGSPTGQYDIEAEHALDCFFEMLDALRVAQAIIGLMDPRAAPINDAIANAEILEGRAF